MSTRTRIAFAALALGILTIHPLGASAGPALAGNLNPGRCHVWSFFGGGTFDAAVTHSHRRNDVYMIVCDPGGEICWAFSFNTGAGGVTLTTGLPTDSWEWWVCAWDDNVGKTKYQAIASIDGQDLRSTGEGAFRVVDTGSVEAPAMVRRLSERYDRQQ